MKRSISLILPLFLLGSCHQDTHYEKVYLPCVSLNTITVDGNTDYLFESLTPATLSERLEKKESFPLFVTAPGCGTCDIFSLTVKDYLRQKKVVLPHIQINAYLMVDSLPKISDTSFVFIKEGKVTFSSSTVSDDFDTTSSLISFMDEHVNSISIPDYSAYSITTPLRGDFNTFTLQNSVSGEHVTEQFDLSAFRESHAKILFINQEDRILSDTWNEYLFLNSDSLDGYCFVHEDIQKGTLKETTLVEETDFSSAIVTYDDTEKGYSLSETAFVS